MKGFTLIELVVVMAVLALVAAVAVPRLPGILAGTRLHAAAREVDAELRRTRGLAILQNREAVFGIDAQNRIIQAAGEARRQLPPGIEMRLITATSERIGAARGDIRFYPNGSSTGGRVLLDQGGRRAAVSVDWLTGRVTVDE